MMVVKSASGAIVPTTAQITSQPATIPLPEPSPLGWDYVRHADGEEVYGYTANQLRAYGDAVRAEERERCAQICDSFASIEGIAQQCAQAIRDQS